MGFSKTLLVVAMLAFPSFAQDGADTNGTLTIWTTLYEQETPQTVLRFHRTNDVTAPLTNWPAFASFINTVIGSNGTITELPIGMQFYACSLSNEFGIVFSDSLPLKLPGRAGKLNVQRN